jgi:hypothetical protein
MHWKENQAVHCLHFLVGTDSNRAKTRQSARRDTRPPGALPEHRHLSKRSTNVAADIAGEQVLQGCVSLQGGRSLLQRSRGETVTPAGAQDLSAHVGVALHGNYASADPEAGRPPNSTSTSSGSSEQSSPKFVVTKIDMISETCSIDQRNPGAKPSLPKTN